MPLLFSLTSRLPPLLFRTTTVLGMMWIVDVGCGLSLDASVSRPSRGAVVPRLNLTSELVCLTLVLVSSSEGLGLGLASALNCQRLISASGFKVLASPWFRLKGLVHIPEIQ